MLGKEILKIIKKKDEEKDKLINTILEQNTKLKEKNNYLERKIEDLYPIAFRIN